jgi:hypothetical protein
MPRGQIVLVSRGADLLTEQEISRSWRKLFGSKDINDETFEKAEALLDELRPESPLRHRLGMELEELRRLKASRA